MNKNRNLYFGPAGWSYKDWEGLVYRKDLKEDRLTLLSSFFDFVEINSSFYQTPSRSTVENWIKKVSFNRNFIFSAKLHKWFSHERQYSTAHVESVKEAFSPLMKNNRLANLLIQFPYSFKHDKTNLQYIETLVKQFRDFPLAIEIRHKSWKQPDFLDFLKKHKIAFCNIDQPEIGESIEPTEITTASIGYIRLHGRNNKEWFNPSATQNERYNYLYSSQELEVWAKRIHKLIENVHSLYVVTNNHFRGQAIVNACQLEKLVTGKTKYNPPGCLCHHFKQLKEFNINAAPEDKQLKLF